MKGETFRISSLPGAQPVEAYREFRRRDGAHCGRSQYTPSKRPDLVVEISHIVLPVIGEPAWETVRKQPMHVRACVSGREIGSLLLKRVRCDSDFLHTGVWDTYSSTVSERYRRLGVGAAMYGHLRQAGYTIAKAKYHSREGSAFWAHLASDLVGGSRGIEVPRDDWSGSALHAIWDKHSPYVGLRERTRDNPLAFLDDAKAAALLDQAISVARWMILPGYENLAREGLARRARWATGAAFLFNESEGFVLMLRPWVRIVLFCMNRRPSLITKSFRQKIRAFSEAFTQFSSHVQTLFEADATGPFKICERCAVAHGCLVKGISIRGHVSVAFPLPLGIDH